MQWFSRKAPIQYNCVTYAQIDLSFDKSEAERRRRRRREAPPCSCLTIHVELVFLIINTYKFSSPTNVVLFHHNVALELRPSTAKLPLNGQATTTPDRQMACKCIKSAAEAISGINLALASALPSKCGVNLPYKISPSIDCSTYTVAMMVVEAVVEMETMVTMLVVMVMAEECMDDGS
ncbi:Non-specific lipid-transfer protein [Capsicum annuum]|nr:Non-specific lipid-transfer protein [Capsicum annuum]